LYFSDKTDGFFWGTGASKAAAVRKASASCQEKDCQLFGWVKNGWLAVSAGRQFYGHIDRTEKAAVTGSMKLCQANNATGCKLIGAYETAFDPKQPTTGGF
jgi:hypothetical protein